MTEADKVRKVLQAAYCFDYDVYCQVMGITDDYYAHEKWTKMQKDFTRWFCELDSENAERFVKWCLK